jgi:hypothetical protein
VSLCAEAGSKLEFDLLSSFVTACIHVGWFERWPKTLAWRGDHLLAGDGLWEFCTSHTCHIAPVAEQHVMLLARLYFRHLKALATHGLHLVSSAGAVLCMAVVWPFAGQEGACVSLAMSLLRGPGFACHQHLQL